VDYLKTKLLEKLELSLTDVQFTPEVTKNEYPSAHEVSSSEYYPLSNALFFKILYMFLSAILLLSLFG